MSNGSSSFFDIIVLCQIGFFIFETAEQLLNHDIIRPTAFPIHALPDSVLFDEIDISLAGKLTSLIGIKNAGEVSITILAKVVSWYYPKTEVLTIYSQDSDTYEFQRKAEASLRELFTSRTSVPVSYKSKDAILCQLFRDGEISIENLGDYRKYIRKITYSKVQNDHSVILGNCLI